MKRTTLFTITHKQWLDAIADWLTNVKGRPDMVMDWDAVIAAEGGVGKSFFNSVGEAMAKPDSYPGRWFNSDQTDFSVYSDPRYVYSLLFGMLTVSGSVMTTIGKLEVGNNVFDVGGSIFTAYRMLQRGVNSVVITNLDDTPQNEFNEYAAERFKLPVSVAYSALFSALPSSVFVCSEYLEHFRDVDVELERLVSSYPARIYESSSFCMPAYGHFIPIRINGEEHLGARSARRALYAKMATLGYAREKVICFNRNFIVFERNDTL